MEHSQDNDDQNFDEQVAELLSKESEPYHYEEDDLTGIFEATVIDNFFSRLTTGGLEVPEIVAKHMQKGVVDGITGLIELDGAQVILKNDEISLGYIVAGICTAATISMLSQSTPEDPDSIAVDSRNKAVEIALDMQDYDDDQKIILMNSINVVLKDYMTPFDVKSNEAKQTILDHGFADNVENTISRDMRRERNKNLEVLLTQEFGAHDDLPSLVQDIAQLAVIGLLKIEDNGEPDDQTNDPFRYKELLTAVGNTLIENGQSDPNGLFDPFVKSQRLGMDLNTLLELTLRYARSIRSGQVDI
jgi:hypothetical protein